ncbi:tryptophan-rich sensory protein [Paenibacillus profundus]|uniref:Tryptophan-rich sensory protein n=1 Tax=Paenibacillus profundus TaxID=1173085 RepID=A0ABS8Y9L3_9BACL|nr:tryptophan-rich sensory protein [Paenibacillus profundus]MCE5168560.1 tryptophan-rich sensory protein [Paenibacillus profundus]
MRTFNYKWLNILAFAAVLAVNTLAETVPLGGKTTGEISAMFPVLFTPASYTFSMWILIYLLLAGFVVHQALPGKDDVTPTIRSIGPLFVFSCLFNIGWILLWHYLYTQVWVSLIAMIGLLTSLILIYNNLRKAGTFTTVERWLVRLPFSIYLGWISVATIINAAVVLYDTQWNGFSFREEAWTVLMLAVGALLAWVVGGPNRDPAFVLVFVWAYIGIAIKQQDIATVAYTAYGLAALLTLLAVSLTFSRRADTHSASLQ